MQNSVLLETQMSFCKIYFSLFLNVFDVNEILRINRRRFYR